MEQRIPLTNPIRVVVTLDDYGKKGDAHKFSRSLKTFLEIRGWQVAKLTREYAYMIPPPGITKPFRFAVEVPDRAQIEKLAMDCHAVGEQWIGQIGEWPAYFVPFREDGFQITPYDPLTWEPAGNTLKKS